MHSNNDNKLWDFLKKDTSFIIFVLTSIGTSLTLIIKGLELTYRYARYTTLNIPLHFLNSGISTKLILSIVFVILTFSVSIFLCIICRSYYEKLKAFWIFDANFHTQKPPKIKRTGINLGFIILFYVVLMFINTPCVLFGVYNITISSLATVYKGNIIKNLIMDCQSYTKYRPNETTGGIFVSWRRKEELPTGA